MLLLKTRLIHESNELWHGYRNFLLDEHPLAHYKRLEKMTFSKS